jgi:hypothetical protein
MADRLAAEIWIGGSIPQSLADALCATISNQGVALDWGGGPFTPAHATELMSARDAEHLHLYDDQASWGQFADLENFLRKHSIPFDRQSEGKYGYDPELVNYRPDQGAKVCITTASGDPVVQTAELQPVVRSLDALGKQLRQGKITGVNVLRRIERLGKLLRSKLPPVAPPLAPFVLEEGR